MPEIFNDPEFEKYRILEIEEGVLMLREFLSFAPKSAVNSDYVQGAMEMLRRIMNLPLKMVPENNESQKEQAKALKVKAFATFETKMLRRFVGGDE